MFNVSSLLGLLPQMLGDIDPIQKALKEHMDVPFVKRMYMQDAPRVDNKDGTHSSHLLEWSESNGKYYVYPTLVDKGGKLYKPKSPFDEALKLNNFIVFDDPQTAMRFAGGAWKPYTRR